MTLEKFLAILTSSSLYFSRGSELGDEFEGKFPTGMMDNIRDSNEHPSIFNMWQQMRNNAQLTTYIYCWFLGNEDQDHMWDRYAGPTGVAIVSTIERLKESFYQENLPVYIGPINYGDEHLLSKSTIGNDFEYWLWKRKEYVEESEVRCIIQHPYIGGQSGVIIRKVNQPPMATDWIEIKSEDTPRGINVNVDLNKLVDKIVFSPSCESWKIKVMEKLINKFDLFCDIKASTYP